MVPHHFVPGVVASVSDRRRPEPGVERGGLAGIAAADQVLLQPTPLILKDGRIANVSIHVVAFPQGQSALGSARCPSSCAR